MMAKVQKNLQMCKKKCNFVAEMDKKRVLTIAEWCIALAACGYLVYRLVVFDDYASLWASLCGMGWREVLALALCVALMPVNMALEAWRWRTLWNGGDVRRKNVRCTKDGRRELRSEGLSWKEAHRQVYYSKLAGVITPWRLGEYPARAMLMESGKGKAENGLWAKVLSMGAVGSATMTMAIVIAGVVGIGGWTINNEQLTINNEQLAINNYYILVGAVFILSIVSIVVVKALLGGSRSSRLSGGCSGAEVSHRLVLVSVGQSMVRLGCWCVQLYLVLFSLGGLGSPGVLGGIGKCAVYYLLVTITPNVPIAEAGVRGAWAVVLFGSVNAALAGVLLWAINTLLPCLIWPFFRKK